jgi:hypothetical protein
VSEEREGSERVWSVESEKEKLLLQSHRNLLTSFRFSCGIPSRMTPANSGANLPRFVEEDGRELGEEEEAEEEEEEEKSSKEDHS